ncbi:MAG: glycosyltransferase family 4 protein [Acutalibacteraceae bacterium]|nr:glycosyltransferase family 4 protein [Acutalibacteraceae bacterium]
MKVLWTVNLIPAAVSVKLGKTSEVLGGWVESMAAKLSENNDIELGIVCKCEENLNFCEVIDGITYFSLYYTSSTSLSELESKCNEIVTKFNPDIVNIEGTEFLHARAMQLSAKNHNIPAVVSLQGILNGQYAYQCGQLPVDDMMFSKSLTNIFSAWIMHLRKTRWYKPRMKPEKEIIENADYILGRTTWDRAHSYAINPNAKYYPCSRILRAPFYEEKWSLEKTERHSIYVGNGYNALKGAHFVVMALPYLIREYPDVKVYIAGYKPYQENDKRSILKKGYAAYLKKLIYDLGVQDHIEFTGPLKAPQVAQMLSKVNAYVLCSTIENSPNTLGEAMMVGTPCVSAYVGGVSDMAEDGKEALFYRNDDPKLLAWNLKLIFDSDELALSLSEAGKKKARITHDPERNAQLLIDAYTDILKEK